MCHKKGFTLIELLVVIAIISLLVSILLPSLSKAKELAKTSLCMSNQRNVCSGLQIYTTESNGCFPYRRPEMDWGSSTLYPDWRRLIAFVSFDGGEASLDCTLDYEPIFECPSKEWTEKNSLRPGSSMNKLLYVTGKQSMMSDIGSAAGTCFTVDSGDYHSNVSLPYYWQNYPGTLPLMGVGFHHGDSVTSGSWIDSVTIGGTVYYSRMGGETVSAFIDGHVEKISESVMEDDFFTIR